MTLALAVETSSGRYALALGELEATEQVCCVQEGPGEKDLQGLLREALGSFGAGVRDIKVIGVNRGPGGLSSTRAGAAFANALSFSLGASLYPFDYFEIAARQAALSTPLPLLCTVPAAAGNAYVALVEQGQRKAAFGPLAPTVAKIAGEAGELALAGRMRGRVPALLPGRTLFDTGIDAPDPAVLLDLTRRAVREGTAPAPQATPLNEEAPEFSDRAAV